MTSRLGQKLDGCISNTVVQVSNAPPAVAVCISKENLTHEHVAENGAFGVSVLKQSTPLRFIGVFGFRSGRDVDKLSGVSFREGVTGCPLVTDNALAVFEARVARAADARTHTLFVGEVVSGEVLAEGKPLAYAYYRENLKGRTPENAPTHLPVSERAIETGTRSGGMKRYVCDVCGYVYDPEKGIPEDGVEPGTPFEDLPDDWVCPVCGAPKDQFSPWA